MVNKLYEESNVSAIAAAIRRKNGLSTTYTSAQMAPAIDMLGRSIINGIIKQYKAKESTVSADRFVEFVNATTPTVGEPTQLSDGSNSYMYASAVLVDTNKVFVTHEYGKYLYGAICTVNGTTVTLESDTQILSGNYYYMYATQVLLDTNKVLVLHRRNNYLYGIVCTINGTTITTGTDKQLSTDSSYSYQYTSATLIDQNKVFVTHKYGDYLYGVVCTVSGTTITNGEDTLISNETESYKYSSVTAIDTNKVFVSYPVGPSGGTAHGVVCTISGTTITVGNAVELSSATASYQVTCALGVDTNTVFVAHNGISAETGLVALHGIICKINGTSITPGPDIRLSSRSMSERGVSVIKLSEGTVFIAYGSGSYLYGLSCVINGTAISTTIDMQLSDDLSSYDYKTAALVSSGNVFVAHRKSSVLYGTAVTGLDDTRVQSSTAKVDGLTASQCTTSSPGSVWVLA